MILQPKKKEKKGLTVVLLEPPFSQLVVFNVGHFSFVKEVHPFCNLDLDVFYLNGNRFWLITIPRSFECDLRSFDISTCLF